MANGLESEAGKSVNFFGRECEAGDVGNYFPFFIKHEVEQFLSMGYFHFPLDSEENGNIELIRHG